MSACRIVCASSTPATPPYVRLVLLLLMALVLMLVLMDAGGGAVYCWTLLQLEASGVGYGQSFKAASRRGCDLVRHSVVVVM